MMNMIADYAPLVFIWALMGIALAIALIGLYGAITEDRSR